MPTDTISPKDIRSFLCEQGKERLIDLLMEQAGNNELLAHKLTLLASKSVSKKIDLKSYRSRIDHSFKRDDFIPYYEACSYTQDVDKAVDALEDLANEHPSEEIIDLIEHTIDKVSGVLECMDDSDGEMGSVLERLQELHLKTCQQVKPDPMELAKKLFRLEIASDFGEFSHALERYASLMGDAGLAVYRKLAMQMWKQVPPKRSDVQYPNDFPHRYTITRIMETLAKLSGNVDELIEIKKKDLTYSSCYLGIAKILQEAKRHDEALQWAERGLKAFPERMDGRLSEWLEEEYHRRKRHDDAMELSWKSFIRSHQLYSYKNLKKNADRTQSWQSWREKALEFIRQTIQESKQQPKNSWEPKQDNSFLVEIFLWEGDDELAWQEAQKGGCSQHWWLELAKKRESNFPADVISIYQREVEIQINHKNNDGYSEAVKNLKKVFQLMKSLNQENEFSSYLSKIRLTHKPKRNLMKLLDEEKFVSS